MRQRAAVLKIRFGLFILRMIFSRYAVIFIEPAPQIYVGAPARTKGMIVWNVWLTADRAIHGKPGRVASE